MFLIYFFHDDTVHEIYYDYQYIITIIPTVQLFLFTAVCRTHGDPTGLTGPLSAFACAPATSTGCAPSNALTATFAGATAGDETRATATHRAAGVGWANAAGATATTSAWATATTAGAATYRGDEATLNRRGGAVTASGADALATVSVSHCGGAGNATRGDSERALLHAPWQGPPPPPPPCRPAEG